MPGRRGAGTRKTIHFQARTMGKPKRPRSQDHASSDDGVVNKGGGSQTAPPSKKKKGNKKRRNGGDGNNRPFDMMVKITRVELTDDYRHAPAPLVAKSETLEDEADKSGAASGEKQEATIEVSIDPASSAVGVDEAEAVEAVSEEKQPVEETSEPARISTDACVSTGIDATTNHDVSFSQEAKPKRQPFIKIIKTKSAKFKPKFRHDNFDRNYTPLPDGDCGDGIKNPHPKEEVPDKFWAQRRRLFSRYDDGIQLDKESWYSVTPEAIADHIAKRMADDCNGKEGAVILDAFCGCGGNAVAFARLPREKVALVVCIDVDKSKLEMAANNAALYGIEADRIVFIQADAVSAMKYGYFDGKCIMATSSPSRDQDKGEDSNSSTRYKIGGLELLPPRIDAVFLSPPWGGMNYGSTGKQGYDVAKNIKLEPWSETVGKEVTESDESVGVATRNGNREVVDGEELMEIASNVTESKRVAYFLPRNTNGISLGRAALKAGYRGSIEMEQNFLNGKFKTMTAYLSAVQQK